MSKREHILHIGANEIVVKIESPIQPRSPMDDYREVSFCLPEKGMYRGVFVLDILGNDNQAPVTWDDNQFQRVKSLDDKSVLRGVAYLIENDFQDSALELIGSEDDKQNDAPRPEISIEMSEIEERIFKNIRNTVQLVRAVGIASSATEVLDYIQTRTKEIVNFLDE